MVWGSGREGDILCILFIQMLLLCVHVTFIFNIFHSFSLLKMNRFISQKSADLYIRHKTLKMEVFVYLAAV